MYQYYQSVKTTQFNKLFRVFTTLLVQEGQHPLTGQRATNFKRDLEAM